MVGSHPHLFLGKEIVMAIFGIDLGTTNSLIGLEETGYLSSIVPSCVNMDTKEAGASQFENMKAMRSFKIDMAEGVGGIMPRTASRFVLEELARTAKHDTGIDVKDVVISVPAYFTDSQRSATVTAAEAAHLNVVKLVNEPTAAAMFIAKNRKELFVVFDLGGGTFDCSIIDSRFGMYDVQATSGICVGGDNMDNNLMRHFIKAGNLPFSGFAKPESKMALKHYASKIKIQLQKTQSDVEVDLTQFGGGKYILTPDTYQKIMHATFTDTINCMQRLISENIPSSEAFSVLLVGGSTHCPYLRRWIEEATGQKPDELTYDPDRVVAQGAALYANLVENNKLSSSVSDVTKRLSIGLVDGTVSEIVPSNSKIPLSMENVYFNPVTADKLILKLYQGDSLLVKNNDCIGELVYEYDEVMPPMMGQVMVNISINDSGVITFSANELLKEPKVIVLNRNTEVE